MQQPEESGSTTARRARAVRRVGAIIMIATGLVWIGQGTGLVPGSFMSRDPFWALMGVLCVGAGIFVGWLAFRADPAGPPDS
jgi:hypothetical protein